MAFLSASNIAQQVLSLVPPLPGGEGHATGGREHATESPRAPQGVEGHTTESPRAPQGGRGDATDGEGQATKAPQGGDIINSPDEQVTPIINTEVHIETNAQVSCDENIIVFVIVQLLTFGSLAAEDHTAEEV